MGLEGNWRVARVSARSSAGSQTEELSKHGESAFRLCHYRRVRLGVMTGGESALGNMTVEQ